ncbi:hypothetical protein Q5P01_008150 [Channa striata]|uniref:N-acetyltransferase domain-containing protein n=1 Tax=Channa striata TaxID=64152 RepID=A0AA88SUH5_CHASR|nr:hypothetical protein Q5P01_008150 [Channa striata]
MTGTKQKSPRNILVPYKCTFEAQEATRIQGYCLITTSVPACLSVDSGLFKVEAGVEAENLWEQDDVNGKSKVVGMVAVIGKRGEEDGDRFDGWNGGVMQGGSEFVQDEGGRSYGEISHAVVNFSWRRKNLGSQLTQKALEFCKERGYGRLVVDVSSPQTAAFALFKKLGFGQTEAQSKTHANRWFSKLAEIKVTRMEKFI